MKDVIEWQGNETAASLLQRSSNWPGPEKISKDQPRKALLSGLSDLQEGSAVPQILFSKLNDMPCARSGFRLTTGNGVDTPGLIRATSNDLHGTIDSPAMLAAKACYRASVSNSLFEDHKTHDRAWCLPCLPYLKDLYLATPPWI